MTIQLVHLSVRLGADEHYPFIERYTGDTQPAGKRRRGLGVEPMTCAPNGSRNGEGLLTLDPPTRSPPSGASTPAKTPPPYATQREGTGITPPPSTDQSGPDTAVPPWIHRWHRR